MLEGGNARFASYLNVVFCASEDALPSLVINNKSFKEFSGDLPSVVGKVDPMKKIDHTELYCILCDKWYPAQVIQVFEEGKSELYTVCDDPHGIGLPKN